MSTLHTTVLLHEVIQGLAIKSTDVVIDCTLGGGGHSAEALKHLSYGGKLFAFDADGKAVERARGRLSALAAHGAAGAQFTLINRNFKHFKEALQTEGVSAVDKVMFDLGLSSDELENSGRGFSFRKDEPLLMTFADVVGEMDMTASDIVNEWEEENIATIILSYGEEKYARRIARGIVAAREHGPIETTKQLTDIILKSTPKHYHFGKIHPATRTFQALRMTVNDEIGTLTTTLHDAFEMLQSGGRIAVISFHSIEDRVVKHYFNELHTAERAIKISKKPLTPTDEEIHTNPRSRSAKLRIIEKK
jgi:16S rRNA (cytosine1402-N4)-methyltransferase